MGLDFLYQLQIVREATPDVVVLLLQYFADFVASFFPSLIIAVVYWCYEKDAGKRFFLAYASATAVTNFLKICICRSRPWILDSRLHIHPSAAEASTGYSTPSGHSTSAGALYTATAVECKKRGITVICVMLILGTAFVRMFLGAHTPIDVTLGVIVGVVCVFVMNKILELVDSKTNGDIILLVISCVIFVVAVIFTVMKSYPANYDINGILLENPIELREDTIKGFSLFIGVVAGIVFEKRCVRFTTDIDNKTRARRVIIGVVLTLFVYVIIGALIKLIFGTFVSALIKRALAYFTATGFVPWLFVRVEKRFG